MRIYEIAIIAFESLWSHPFRAILAGLGVVFGVGAVIAMLSVAEGAKQASLKQIEILGVNKIILKSERPKKKEKTKSLEYGLNKADYHHFSEVLSNVNNILPIRNTYQSIKSKKDVNIKMFACGIDLLKFTNSELYSNTGRFFNKLDNDHARSVCVIGINAARELFEFESPIGKTLSIKGHIFEIVGILKNKYSYKLSGDFDLNDLIFISMGTAEALWREMIFTDSLYIDVDYDYLYVEVANVNHILDTSNRIKAYLEEKHPNNDVSIEVPFELMKQQEQTNKIFSIVLLSSAMISLLVGGIGIMNIMLANIYERMREIGTRRALGATRNNILFQFLFESILLTTTGGIFGSILGVGLSKLVENYGDMPTLITPFSIVIAMLVSIATGIIFGTLPAWKAAQLHPIEALRHE